MAKSDVIPKPTLKDLEQFMAPPACDGATWGHCGALGGALRRASEAEREVKRGADALLVERIRVRELETRLRLFSRENLLAVSTFPAEQPSEAAPQLSGCPKCGSDASTVRGLRKSEIERGWKVCSRCFTRYDS